MTKIYIYVSDEGAEYIKENIKEAEINENNFVEIKNENLSCYFDTRIGLTIYETSNMTTVYSIPAKMIKTIFTL